MSLSEVFDQRKRRKPDDVYGARYAPPTPGYDALEALVFGSGPTMPEPDTSRLSDLQALSDEVSAVRIPRAVPQGSFGTSSAYRAESGRFPATAPVAGRYRISQGPGAGHSTGPGGRAWDYAVPQGTRAVATQSGRVTAVRDLGNRSYGRYVTIRGADGREYVYAHLSSFGVRPGQSVRAGQVIGRTGSTGRSTGAHLHFETRG